ncbi:phosphatidylinositol mannoside acyltransferase [Tsukamurella sp. 8F]|uniref:phosphatidylinositol mannoside acyltransferase n=1 Tax=unclassified Tsukamurella TaxID=2633480 RepID=UPI0023B9BA19|nr:MULTISPECIES: phosphatidylinositol mannoside acyltransferase [unclassified Tsukamurella]MDF0531382.1 phosphatidylinositol mannoside acyltransferase [Tsukamurella sp. 8J]MDF0585312.1 phosphatidylinositol mannoside acyltransferase [Tsukamurella sp. 8F]
MSELRSRAADLGYGAGWAVTRRIPDRIAQWGVDGVGALVGRRDGGPEQLRRNLARVIGVDPADVPEALMVDAVRSYARYWKEAFRLPSMDLGEVGRSIDRFVDAEPLHEAMAAGRGAVLALPHSGNWDMAGVWLVHRYGKFATVAERLEPESLFRRFVDYRETLGFEVFPLSGGEQPPFPQLADRLRAGGVVCLLGERDLARHGVPVTFFGEPTRMPAGPAKLAIDTGAPLLPVHCWFTDGGWGFKAEDEIDVSRGVAYATQKLAEAFERNIAAHPADWHMLQPLWEADWSQARRERILGADRAPEA